MRGSTRIITFAALLSGSLWPMSLRAQSSGGPDENFIMLVSRFTGDEDTGGSLANLVRLQISATFQKPSAENLGRMIWREVPITSHEEALRRGLTLTALAHLVTWGNTYTLEDGVALQTYLTVTDRFWWRGDIGRPPPGVWQIAVPNASDPDSTIVLGLPRSLYRLPVVLYDRAAAEYYTSLNGLPIYEARNFKKVIGRTRISYTAHQYTDKAVHLTSGGITGWVPIDFVSEENNVMVNFVSAVFRTVRGDYDGARENLDKVLEYEALDQGTLINTLLVYGLCLELDGKSGLQYFKSARDLAPLDAVVARYYLAGIVQLISRDGATNTNQESLEAAIIETERLFSPDSKWFDSIRRYAKENLSQ